MSKFVAAVIASSSVLMRSGTRLHPGDFKIFSSCDTVLSIMYFLHMSILLITTKMGTFSARAYPRCSLVVPAKTGQLKVTFKIKTRTDIYILLSYILSTAKLKMFATTEMSYFGILHLLKIPTLLQYPQNPCKHL